MLAETYTTSDEIGSHRVDLERGTKTINREMVDALNTSLATNGGFVPSLREMLAYVHGHTDRVPSTMTWKRLIEANDELAIAFREGKSVTYVHPDGEFDTEVQSKIAYAHEPQPIHVADMPDAVWGGA
jgi:hypothetical protein